MYKNESQKIINLLNSSSNHPLKFSTKKWHSIDSETKSEYKKRKCNIVHYRFS